MGHYVRHNKLQHLHRPARSNPALAASYPPASADPPLAIPYPAALPSSSYDNSLVPYPANITTYPCSSISQQEQLNQAIADVRRHSRNERIGEIGAAAAGAFALYELHEAKVDPAHARRHKMEAQLAGAVALGSAGYAYHEQKEKKKSEHVVEYLSGAGYSNKDSSHKQGHPYVHDPKAMKKSEHKETKKCEHMVEVLSGVSHHTKYSTHKRGRSHKHHHNFLGDIISKSM